MTEQPLKNPAAVSLGKLGGKSTSEAKQAAARANGKKGGRPKTGDNSMNQPTKDV